MKSNIEQYDVVRLSNGLKAQIVEVLKEDVMYVADVQEVDGWPENDTIFVECGDIAENLKTWGTPSKTPQN